MKQTRGRIALLILLMDLALKMTPLPGNRTLVPGILRVHPALRNQGVSFGLLGQSPLLTLALTAVLVLAGAMWLREMNLSRLEETAAGLMLGGAMGNLIDRALHGGVTDYLEFLFMRFPVFNLADICLVAGAGLLALGLILPGKQAGA